MGKINIRGGSALHLNFEVGNEESPKDFDVELVRHGNAYHVVRTANGEELETQPNAAADMKGKRITPRHVEVDYEEK